MICNNCINDINERVLLPCSNHKEIKVNPQDTKPIMANAQELINTSNDWRVTPESTNNALSDVLAKERQQETRELRRFKGDY